MGEFLQSLYASFFGASVLVAPEYLLLCVVIGFGIYLWRRRTGRVARGFWRWLTPRDIYLHKSHLLDLQLFAMSRVMSFLGLLGRISVATAVAVWVAGFWTPTEGAADLSPWMMALILWLTADFCVYWIHRLHHRWAVIWPLHAVHHSAEVLTPFTAYRQHPLAIVLTVFVSSALIGGVQGGVIGALGSGTIDTGSIALQVAGVNAFQVLANAAMANFHHSHVWISFGPVLERIVISPAQHQIHHSTRPEHFDRNFGQTLALWDWAFGSLYVVRQEEDLRFGLDGEEHRPLGRHGLLTTLWHPIAMMAGTVSRPSEDRSRAQK